jgi:Flp pilus assembly protein TadG
VSRRDPGQATVELALGLPLLVLVALATLQVGLVARDRLAVQLAAREAARAAAVSPAASVARAAAERATSLRPLDVALRDDGRTVTVTVRAIEHTDVPMVGAMLPDVHLEATVTMAIEPP